MAQTSVSSFFISRKRGIDDELVASKKKVICLEKKASSGPNNSEDLTNIVYPSSSKTSNNDEAQKEVKMSNGIASVRQGITPQRTRASRRVHMQNVEGIETPKIANFFFGGSLSPQKKSKKQNELVEPAKDKPVKQQNDKDLIKKHQGMSTPTKKPPTTIKAINNHVEKTQMISTNSMNTDEIKRRIRGSSKLTELKTSLNKLRNGFDKLDQMEQKRKESAEAAKSLKPFKNIELEILR